MHSTSQETRTESVSLDLTGIRIPLILVGADLHVRQFSPAMTELLNTQPGNPDDLLQALEEKFRLKDFADAIRGSICQGRPYEQEISRRGGDAYSLCLRPFKSDPDGAAHYGIITLFNMSHLGRTRSCAKLFSETTSMMMDMVKEPLVALDKDMIIRCANKSFFHTFFISPEEAEGGALGTLAKGRLGIAELKDVVSQVFQNGSAIKDYEARLPFPMTGERVLLLSARPLDGEKENEAFVLMAIEDITEKRQIEEAVQEKIRKIIGSNQELQRFVSMAAHDLKEPLAVLSIYTELLEENNRDKFDAESSQYAASIQTTVQKMIRLIDDLLKFARMDVSSPLERVETSHAVEHALASLKKPIRESGALIRQGDLPPVSGNPGLLLQLFQQLISNALKFQDEKSPVIEINAEPQGNVWLFSVRDNGIGIDPQDAKKIFEMFERIHDKSRYEGSGLGLALCKKIVEHHGGAIWVDSQPGKGSTFRFTLPRVS